MMKEEFEKYVHDNNLIGPSSKILLAVSGGIDSMVMTHLFRSIGTDFGIAHCNFNLRGSESDEDERFVRQYAATCGYQFHVAHFDTPGFAAEKGISIQMAARELRYRWFEEIREQYGYSSIALAHNLNDNVETFLINLTRGTGIAGLTGMRPSYNKLIRPLLFAPRNALEKYSIENGVAYREDRSNSDTKYTRNKLRHEVIPLFREINPSFDATISETAERLSEINEMVNAFILPLRERIFSQKDDCITVKIKDLPEGSWRRTVLYQLFRPFGIGASRLDELDKLITGKTGSILYTGEWRLIRNRGEIIASPRDKTTDVYFEISTPAELNSVPFIESAILESVPDKYSIPSSPEIACLDADKITWPLRIRRIARGDSFYPLGMSSRKKLSDYFIDRKYPLTEKEKKLVIESDGRIIWIIGDRIDNRYRITSSTRNALVIKLRT